MEIFQSWGGFSRTRSVEKKKTNLLVFLTPHIVKEAEQLARLTETKRQEYARSEEMYKQGELLVKFREDTPRNGYQRYFLLKAHRLFAVLKPRGTLSHKTEERAGCQRGCQDI